MRGEYIRDIPQFENFYHCKYNYRDQDRMWRRMARVKAKLLWEYKLGNYTTYLQMCTDYPELTDLDVCSCSNIDRSSEIP